ncbi:MAG: hypothetical protein NO516_06990 [Candidatus Methanomethylicia archaeon]|nr:hypothetical protein [Candidatus Methanomethylicia archaeon]
MAHINITCVYLGFISDIAGRMPEEKVAVQEGTTLSRLLDLLESMHPGFKAAFINRETAKPILSRQVLITPKGKQTGPPSKGLETILEEGMRVIFW